MEPETNPDCLSEPVLLRYVQGDLAPEEARRAEIHLDTCADCLEVVAVLGDSSNAKARGGADPSARYELGDRIAHGGMGKILSGWDRVLDRPVAIKMVRVGDALSRERLGREMVVTARLQHPAIVPVYDGGTLEDGTPYYVMRRVDGRELETLIAESESLTQRLELVRPFIALVDAVAYAHAEKFVHRDLKPRNVLVGPFGETVVLDWGLAKSLAAVPLPEPETLAGSDPSEPGLTATGAVMGTPGYIAPEIHAGRTASPRSDVYSLGVILARILSGEAPEPAARLTDASIEGAPADLVAIARRATEAEPEDRYADAGELAGDLRRFEAGRRVAARTYGVLDRLVRFVRRHRAAVSVAGVACVALLGFGGWSYRNVSRARGQTEVALADAQRQRATAEREREAAEELIDFGLEDLSRDLEEAGKPDLLADLIEEVNGYYAGRGRPDDPRWALRRAKALKLESEIEDHRGDGEAAIATGREAETLLVEAAADPQLTEDADLSRCDVFRHRAIILRNGGDPDGATESATACIELARRYVADDPEDTRWHRRLASAQIVRLLVLESLGETEKAASGMKALLAHVDAVSWGRELEATALNFRRIVEGQLGTIALHDARPDEAVAHFERALRHCVRLQELRPGTQTTLSAVAGARMELAVALGARDREAEAARELELAIGIYDVLLEIDPADAVVARNRSIARRQLTTIRISQDRTDDALATARANVAGMRALADRLPNDLPIRLQLGFVLVDLADVSRRSGQPDRAAESFEDGLGLIEEVMEKLPDYTLGERKLVFALLRHGDFELERGNLDAAAASLERARALARKHLERQPSAGKRLQVAEPTARLVVIRWRQGAEHDARDLLEELRDQIAQARAEGADSPLAADLLRRVEDPARALGVSL